MHKLEIPCRILLILHVVVSLLGYISFFQTEYQLVSPLIPSNLVWQIARHSMIASIISGSLLVPSLLFYFFQRRTWVVACSLLALVLHWLQSNYAIL
ncbi:MAG TPA: hypothetical protein PKL81_13605 [Ferruginibacter sp.]|nr:hypothetical protein [Chitinophagales bacterium]HNJ95026.1 hypothetical protein [Ferruginibacter sp.]HNK30160.1 hypothetical protein [Ferruginibacter sp.]HNL66131.1 hypothetical protein [Ferruginibacter sp.]HNN72163.1 hypothetical protein [Ferruginibacter sp.]